MVFSSEVNGCSTLLTITFGLHCTDTASQAACTLQGGTSRVVLPGTGESTAALAFKSIIHQLPWSSTAWGSSTSPSLPHYTQLSAARFCSYPHHKDFGGPWSLRAIHLFLLSTLARQYPLLGFPHPLLLAISSLSLAGHFRPMPLNWRFSPPSKELVTFTAWHWNLWTELSHGSAKLVWLHLPHSRKLDILQLPFCFPV